MAHPTAIRTVLAWSVENGYFIYQTDIQLHHGQYGLRQSSAAFAKTLLHRLYEFGFKAASADKCLLVYREPMEGANDRSKSVLVILTVIDDLLEVENDQRLLRRVLDHLKQYFQLTEDGKINFFL
eukprot:770458-Rhodomonas_salina.1